MSNTVEITAWTAKQTDYGANIDKFYRVYTLGPYAIFQWGRIGVIGQFQIKDCGSKGEAHSTAMNKLDAKLRKGYEMTLRGATFAFDADRFTADKAGAQRLAHAYDAAFRSRSAGASQARPQRAPTPVQTVEVDPIGQLTDATLDAITRSATDPAGAMVAYATIREQFSDVEEGYERARSYLETLEQLVTR